jgi:hypothetical protein
MDGASDYELVLRLRATAGRYLAAADAHSALELDPSVPVKERDEHGKQVLRLSALAAALDKQAEQIEG